MEIDIEYDEYECGRPCTQDGCVGHSDGIPVALIINNVTFNLDTDEKDSKKIVAAVDELFKAIG